MRESFWITIAFIITLGIIFAVSIFGLFLGNNTSSENMLGILFAFALGMLFTELVNVRNDEKRTEDVLKDLLVETKIILDKGAPEQPGKLYSATWSLIKSSGMPTRIDSKLRKKLADMFLKLEIYNDDVQRYQDYSIQSKPNREVEQGFNESMQESKKELLVLCEEVIKLAQELGKAIP